MAISVQIPGGLRAPRPAGRRIFRVLAAIAAPFLRMSVSGMLQSRNAQEIALSLPAGEDNWQSRLTFCNLLADALERTPDDVPAADLANKLEPLWSGIIDAALCERTTLSLQACRLLGALAKALRQQYHPHMDRVLPALIRQAASTKAVAQKAASSAISNIIFYSGFNLRILYHVCQTFDDKYSAPKLYAPSWLKLIIENFYPALHADRDYEQISRAIALGLEEADNNVRINTRATFWAYHKINQTGAEEIMAKLNNHAKTALVNDPNNPDKPTKAKGKKPTETAAALAEIKQQAKERLKQKTVERSRVISAKTITSEDFPVGQLETKDDKQVHKKHNVATAPPEMLPPPTKSTSRSINVLQKAPVRRPRIVATPINPPQSSSRPASRTGMTQPVLPAVAKPIEEKSNTLKAPIRIPRGKENEAFNYEIAKRIDRINRSPERTIVKPAVTQETGSIFASRTLVPEADGLTKEQRLHQHDLDKQIAEMVPHMDQMIPLMEKQNDERGSQLYHAYPGLNHDGHTEDARRALDKALEYLNKDALDYMGFRKLRKLFEDFGRHLIIDQAIYDLVWAKVLPKVGNFDELLTQTLHEVSDQSHPRYIRHAVLTIVCILVRDYPYEWSYEYQGPALAACMIARCAYSPNCQPREDSPYVAPMTIVNQITTVALTIIASCTNPVSTMDSVISMLTAGETFLLHDAPHDSEIQESFASFNPYSKLNRLQCETNGILFPLPKALDTFDNQLERNSISFKHLRPRPLISSESDTTDPEPLPKKLCLLMETGLRTISLLLERAHAEGCKLGPVREHELAEMARHLMSSYNTIIRRHVMEYCRVLYQVFESESRFWTHFTNEQERNLLHYYLQGLR